jgi:hypothetical protein
VVAVSFVPLCVCNWQRQQVRVYVVWHCREEFTGRDTMRQTLQLTRAVSPRLTRNPKR